MTARQETGAIQPSGRTSRRVLLLIGLLGLSACASFNPSPIGNVAFKERAQTQTEKNVRVTVAVPSSKESRQIFGVDLYRRGIQPIWLEIENRDEGTVRFFPASLDPDYFTPFETAFRNHFATSGAANREMDRYFYERGKRVYIAPGSTRSGFVFTNLDEGTKEFTVDLAGEDHEFRSFLFFVNVPGLRVDHHEVDFDNLYSEYEIICHDEECLRKALENLPRCTTDKKGTGQGDPLNLVFVGEAEDVLYALIRSGWDETETIHGASAWKTTKSFLFGGRYRYSPVSGLYVFGRPQDAAFQKIRESIHERNHLRVWLAPIRAGDKPVWVGQISRDIGVRFTRKTIVTHKIDANVDETREYLLEDLLYSQAIAKIGYVKGVGEAPMSEPRTNLTGDPYFTDGYRAVLQVSGDPVDFEELEFLDWEIPPDV